MSSADRVMLMMNDSPLDSETRRRISSSASMARIPAASGRAGACLPSSARRRTGIGSAPDAVSPPPAPSPSSSQSALRTASRTHSAGTRTSSFARWKPKTSTCRASARTRSTLARPPLLARSERSRIARSSSSSPGDL